MVRTPAQGAAKRAASLTHRLLAFSRRQTLDPRPTDANDLVAGMVELIQHAVGPGIAVETLEEHAIWTTLVDPGQLENSLLNICINARDAMPDGGRIVIETRNQFLDSEAAGVLNLPEGEYLRLGVTDTGTGTPPDIIAKAFAGMQVLTKPFAVDTLMARVGQLMPELFSDPAKA